MDENSRLHLVNPAPEPKDPEERFALALERLGPFAPEPGSRKYFILLGLVRPSLAPDDPVRDLSKGLHLSGEWGALDRWPKGFFVDVDEAERQRLKKAAAWLRRSLTTLLAKQLLPFRSKRSTSSTRASSPNPSQET